MSEKFIYPQSTKEEKTLNSKEYIDELIKYFLSNKKYKNNSLIFKSPKADYIDYDFSKRIIKLSNAFFENEGFFKFIVGNYQIEFQTKKVNDNEYELPDKLTITRNHGIFYFPDYWLNIIKIDELYGELKKIKDNEFIIKIPNDNKFKINNELNIELTLIKSPLKVKTLIKNIDIKNNYAYINLEFPKNDEILNIFEEFEKNCLNNFLLFLEKEVLFYLMNGEYND